jgi:hypothetical protein
MSKGRFAIAVIVGATLATSLSFSFPYLRERAIRESLSVCVVGIRADGKAIRVEYELSYDTARTLWLRWFAPQSILVDRGLLSSSALPGQRMEWLTPDGRIEPASDWAIEDVNSGEDIAAIKSGKTIKAAFDARPGEGKKWQMQCRVVIRVVLYRHCGLLVLSRSRITKHINGERFEGVCISKTSPLFVVDWPTKRAEE